MRKFLFLSALLFVCMVCQLVFFIYVVSSYDSRVERFRVEERLFRSAVEYACTNFLASYMEEYTNLLETTSNGPEIAVKIVSLSTWFDYSGRAGCQIDGARYSVGDYTPFGLIVKIADNRVYCKNGLDYVILRGSKDDLLSRPRSGAPRAPDEDGESGAL